MGARELGSLTYGAKLYLAIFYYFVVVFVVDCYRRREQSTGQHSEEPRPASNVIYAHIEQNAKPSSTCEENNNNNNGALVYAELQR